MWRMVICHTADLEKAFIPPIVTTSEHRHTAATESAKDFLP